MCICANLPCVPLLQNIIFSYSWKTHLENIVVFVTTKCYCIWLTVVEQKHSGENIFNVFASNSLRWHHDGRDASHITSLTIVYSTVHSGADQSKHQSSASLAFVWGIRRGPVNSPQKWPVTRKLFLFNCFCKSVYSWMHGKVSRAQGVGFNPCFQEMAEWLIHDSNLQ